MKAGNVFQCQIRLLKKKKTFIRDFYSFSYHLQGVHFLLTQPSVSINSALYALICHSDTLE